MERRTFLKGMLGCAAAPLVAKAEIILPFAEPDQIIPVVPQVLENNRWLMLASTHERMHYWFKHINHSVILNDLSGFTGITNPWGGSPKITVGGTELCFLSAGNMAHLLGSEFTGAYFLDDGLTHEQMCHALMRTQRWPKRPDLPTNFEWPTVNDTIEELLRVSNYTA